ncbi:MAG: hypothetical protein ACK5NK_02635 [Niabella sp.]
MKKLIALFISCFAMTAITFANKDLEQINSDTPSEIIENNIIEEECTTYSKWTCPNGDEWEVYITADDCETAEEDVVETYELLCE